MESKAQPFEMPSLRIGIAKGASLKLSVFAIIEKIPEISNHN
jgi:hypothetical protein